MVEGRNDVKPAIFFLLVLSIWSFICSSFATINDHAIPIRITTPPHRRLATAQRQTTLERGRTSLSPLPMASYRTRRLYSLDRECASEENADPISDEPAHYTRRTGAGNFYRSDDFYRRDEKLRLHTRLCEDMSPVPGSPALTCSSGPGSPMSLRLVDGGWKRCCACDEHGVWLDDDVPTLDLRN